jgi:hypothetical protein
MDTDNEKSRVTSAERYDADLEKRFSPHSIGEVDAVKMARLEALAKNLAYQIKELTPFTREQSLALTHLEETVFWANAAIARNE